MEYTEFSGKTVDDAITEACQKLTITSDKLDYIVVEKGSTGFLGFGNKPAIIKARIKSDEATESVNELAVDETNDNKAKDYVVNVNNDPKEFLDKVFKAMEMMLVVVMQMLCVKFLKTMVRHGANLR